ncbi:hypothetical protein BH23GEM6_BH23GEM6_03400 [soil metagenome]
MRSSTLLLPLLLLVSCATAGGVPPIQMATAPAAEEEAVVGVIVGVFDAMRAADSTAFRAGMHREARLTTVVDRDGQSSIQVVPMDAFITAVGTARTEVWDERISRPEVRVDGNLATAWMNYSFYRGDQFSHCGVNAMQLHRGEQGWRIVQIADTRRQEGCGPVQN